MFEMNLEPGAQKVFFLFPFFFFFFFFSFLKEHGEKAEKRREEQCKGGRGKREKTHSFNFFQLTYERFIRFGFVMGFSERHVLNSLKVNDYPLFFFPFFFPSLFSFFLD